MRNPRAPITRWSRASAALIALAAALCGAGCTGRFSARTEYLAPGFTRAALRGKSVAVVAPQGGAPRGFEDEMAGVTRAVRETGARVFLVAPDDPAAKGIGGDSAVGQNDRAVPEPSPDRGPAVAYLAAQSSAPDPAYLLVVRVTGADVYHRYVAPAEPGAAGRGGAAYRTSGRRLGLRLALLRLPSRAPVWVATGGGEMWSTRSDAAPAAAAGPDPFPPPPSPRKISRLLARRLLAAVPSPPELEPN